MQRDGDPTDDDPLLRAYHPVRWIPASDAPWPGMLVRLPDGESSLLVDAALLGADWPGWRAEPGGHLLAPFDVVRRRHGHDAAMPVCPERVDAFLARRAAHEAVTTLDDGEAVTLAVSLLRGSAEAARQDGSAPGEWWLTDTGRPVLALVDVVRTPSTEQLLEIITETTSGPLEAALRRAIAAVAAPRTLVRDLDQLESQLFRAADPRPLATSASAPLAPHIAIGPLRREAHPEPPSRWLDAIARHVDADLAAMASDAAARVWRRLVRPRAGRADRRPARGRRGAWLVAGLVGAVILGVGLMWPTGGGPATADSANTGAAAAASPAASDSTGGAAPPASSPAADGPAAQTRDAASPADWVTATAELLIRRTTCGDDAACMAEVAEDPTRAFAAGVIDTAPSERSITLLDEFGGAAVLRVDSTTGAGVSQLIVVVLTDGRLLLRDVHDVAEKEA